MGMPSRTGHIRQGEQRGEKSGRVPQRLFNNNSLAADVTAESINTSSWINGDTMEMKFHYMGTSLVIV